MSLHECNLSLVNFSSVNASFSFALKTSLKESGEKQTVLDSVEFHARSLRPLLRIWQAEATRRCQLQNQRDSRSQRHPRQRLRQRNRRPCQELVPGTPVRRPLGRGAKQVIRRTHPCGPCAPTGRNCSDPPPCFPIYMCESFEY